MKRERERGGEVDVSTNCRLRLTVAGWTTWVDVTTGTIIEKRLPAHVVLGTSTGMRSCQPAPAVRMHVP